jgi:hypothetical protein
VPYQNVTSPPCQGTAARTGAAPEGTSTDGALVPGDRDPSRYPPSVKSACALLGAVIGLACIDATALFLLWCGADLITVQSRNYPANHGSLDWLVVAGIPASMAFNIYLMKSWSFRNAILLGLTEAVLGVVGAVALVLIYGIPFHLSIGGSL